ncbi:MAG: hypothetical protein OJF51_003175 [Nitrospira sp.]|nr:MAG: hypothetical protein OJF51_003175 [Nitrospira sp.]
MSRLHVVGSVSIYICLPASVTAKSWSYMSAISDEGRSI